MELIIINVDGLEIQAEAPRGFWAQSPELRISYIQAKWPSANWAGNGECGVYASYHNLQPSGTPS